MHIEYWLQITSQEIFLIAGAKSLSMPEKLLLRAFSSNCAWNKSRTPKNRGWIMGKTRKRWTLLSCITYDDITLYLKSGGKNSAKEGCIGTVHDIFNDTKKRLDMKFTIIGRMCTQDLFHCDIVIVRREQDPKSFSCRYGNAGNNFWMRGKSLIFCT